MKKYISSIEISKGDFERINRLMMVDFGDYASDSMKELIDELDARPDTVPYSFCFEFEDGSAIQLGICSDSLTYFDSWMWISANKEASYEFDCFFEIQQENVFAYDGKTYVCKFVIKEE